MNVTPDSFSDGGRCSTPDDALQLGLRLAEEGADILDVGGESTRPGAVPVSIHEELSRVIPVIRGLAANSETPISIDTTKSQVAEAALRAGASMVNDISGLTSDIGIAEVVAQHDAGICLMHMRGTPSTMTAFSNYSDIVAEVIAELQESIDRATGLSVPTHHMWVDPGFGFAKNTVQNLQLLHRLSEVKALRLPILVGTSRKSMIGNILGLPVEDRLEGTAATIVAAIMGGAAVVRVHDVHAMSRVVRMTDAIRCVKL